MVIFLHACIVQQDKAYEKLNFLIDTFSLTQQ